MKRTIISVIIIMQCFVLLSQTLNNNTRPANGVGSIGTNIPEPEMVAIQGGSFRMGYIDGDADEKPVHKVIVSSFKMGKFEVTFKEFAAFINATGYVTDAERVGYSYIYTYYWEKHDGVTWKDDEEGHKQGAGDGDKPVIHVSWNDATAYCKWLRGKTGKAYRLPTEAEWEYAAGNGEKHTRYSWGDYMPVKEKKENEVKEKKKGKIVPELKQKQYVSCTNKFEENKNGCFFSDKVGTYTANELGLYDMSGNVWEWCSDWYGEDYYSKSPAENPKGPEYGGNRVIRGANWVYYPENSRITYRTSSSPSLSNYNIGFRVACSI